MSAEIWADLADAKVIFFAGGSWEDYEKLDNSTAKAIEDRYYVTNLLHGKKVAKAKYLGYLPPKSETASMSKGRGDFLPSTTEYAIEFLNSRANDGKGFFLMVEGARIDKSSHDNDFPSMVKEVLDFDRAVEAAIRFAEKDGNTLVIISADHETGALSLRGGDPSKGKVKGAFSSKGHTGIPVPLFAYGPGSQHFMGVQENSDVSNKIEALLTE
jgi:alkaline phosphatase